MARDSQRSKVYRAESRWSSGHDRVQDTVDLRGAQQLLDRWSSLFGVGQVRVERNARLKQYGGWYRQGFRLIEVKHPQVTMSVLMHEFAHHLAYERWVGSRGPKDPGHDGSFVETLVSVVERLVGETEAQGLVIEFVGAGCRTSRAQFVSHLQDLKRRRELARQREADRVVDYVVWQIRHGAPAQVWSINVPSEWTRSRPMTRWIPKGYDGPGVWKPVVFSSRAAAVGFAEKQAVGQGRVCSVMEVPVGGGS